MRLVLPIAALAGCTAALPDLAPERDQGLVDAGGDTVVAFIDSDVVDSGACAPASAVYDTPGRYRYVVPDECYKLTVEAWGAGGGASKSTGSGGGGGASRAEDAQGKIIALGGGGGGAGVSASGGGGGYGGRTIAVEPGDAIEVFVGGGGHSACSGGGEDGGDDGEGNFGAGRGWNTRGLDAPSPGFGGGGGGGRGKGGGGSVYGGGAGAAYEGCADRAGVSSYGGGGGADCAAGCGTSAFAGTCAAGGANTPRGGGGGGGIGDVVRVGASGTSGSDSAVRYYGGAAANGGPGHGADTNPCPGVGGAGRVTITPGGVDLGDVVGGDGYLVLTAGSWAANDLGGLAGAAAKCIADLLANDWLGKPDATARGLLVAERVLALLCDGAGCTNLEGRTTMRFARSGQPDFGGDTFVTEPGGAGPNNRYPWNVATKFGDVATYWTGRAAGQVDRWSSSSLADQCGGFTATTGTARVGRSVADAYRWSEVDAACTEQHRLLCLVLPR